VAGNPPVCRKDAREQDLFVLLGIGHKPCNVLFSWRRWLARWQMVWSPHIKLPGRQDPWETIALKDLFPSDFHLRPGTFAAFSIFKPGQGYCRDGDNGELKEWPVMSIRWCAELSGLIAHRSNHMERKNSHRGPRQMDPASGP
jgi:hypothetical protein